MNTNARFPDAENDAEDNKTEINYRRIAKGLGWFSLALGAAEVAAPGILAHLVGVRNGSVNRWLLRSPMYGMREIATGVGILNHPRPSEWLWARVAGDLVDLGTLALSLRSDENDRRRLTAAILAVAGITVLDYITAQNLAPTADVVTGSSEAARFTKGVRAMKSVSVNATAQQAYSFWRDFEHLPGFMRHLESVTKIDDDRSRWRVNAFGKTFQWEAQITEDEPNRRISWCSTEDADIENSGTVVFEPAPGGRGTIVHVDMFYAPPAGSAGASLAKVLGRDAGQMLADDLRAFRQAIEVGEVIQSDASIHRTMHPAQPSQESRRTA